MDNIPAVMLIQGDIIHVPDDASPNVIETVDFLNERIFLTVSRGSERYPIELLRSDRVNIATYTK